MDALFALLRRYTDSERPTGRIGRPPSGVFGLARLLMAFAIIAGIVAALDLASQRMAPQAPIATTVLETTQ